MKGTDPKVLLGELEKGLEVSTGTYLFFENSLSKDRWHSDLLQRMCIPIKDERVEVIKDKTFLCLDELRRFRHFNRYYYSTNYDWDRIDFLIKKMHQVHPLVITDINKFIMFLNDLMLQD